MFHERLQQRESVFNLQEVKTPFSAMSPPPPGSDDAELTTFRLTILGRTPVIYKSSKDDGVRCEGYDESKDNVPRAGVCLRKLCFCQQAKGRRSGYSLHTPCPYTQELLFPCVKVCQHLST